MIGCLVVSFKFQSNCAAFVLGLFRNHSCSCHLSLDALASVTVYLVLLSQCLYWRVHGKWVLDVDVWVWTSERQILFSAGNVSHPVFLAFVHRPSVALDV